MRWRSRDAAGMSAGLVYSATLDSRTAAGAVRWPHRSAPAAARRGRPERRAADRHPPSPPPPPRSRGAWRRPPTSGCPSTAWAGAFTAFTRVCDGAGFGRRIRVRAGVQGLHKLLVKRGDLRAQPLKALCVRGEQRGDLRRYLVGGGGQQPGRRGGGCRIGRADRRTKAGQVRGGISQQLRCREQVRTSRTSPNFTRPALGSYRDPRWVAGQTGHLGQTGHSPRAPTRDVARLSPRPDATVARCAPSPVVDCWDARMKFDCGEVTPTCH